MKTKCLTKLLLLAACLGWGQENFAQTILNFSFNQAPVLVASAGMDEIICTGDAVTLGENPTASGGTPPYTYEWMSTVGINLPATSNPTATPMTSTNYFMLVTDELNCTDRDSVFIEVDNCVGIPELLGVTAFKVYPNPNQGEFFVELELNQGVENLKISVVDLAGKSVYLRELPLDSNIGIVKESVRLRGLARGIYYIRVELDEKQISRKIHIH